MSAFEGRILEGRYRVEAVLGRGGMGVVHRGTQLALDRPVAIKRLLAAEDADPAVLARFHREAVMTGRLSHPNVVGVVDAGIDRGEPYLVMELVDGASLDAWLARRGRLPVAEALALTWQVADALAAAHAVGILHRDVKPSNVLVDRDGRARVVDFGLARLARQPDARLTAFGAFVGTPEYLAPEIALGEEPDERTDVYALGVLLYELATGTVPFVGSTAVATVLAHVSARLDLPSQRVADLPPAFDRLIAGLMARSRDDRPRDARAARTAIERTMRGLAPGDVAIAAQPPARIPGTHVPRTTPPRSREQVELDAVLLAALVGEGRSSP